MGGGASMGMGMPGAPAGGQMPMDAGMPGNAPAGGMPGGSM